MSKENTSGGFGTIGGFIVIGIILLAIGVYNKNAALEQGGRQCLSKGVSAAKCACLVGELDRRISILHETPLIRILLKPSDAEAQQIQDLAIKSCI